jgi:multidrug transporter EmrE-like cation transporter
MNVELLFTLAMLLALVASFAMSASSLRRCDLAIGYSVFIERGSARCATRIRAIGRQDVHLLCTIVKLLGGAASSARGCAARV